jgi:hypothetical protein
MQLFFQAPSAAYSLLAAITSTSGTAESLAKEVHDNPPFTTGMALAFLLLAQVIAIIAYWIASKAVAGENGTFGNALKLWLLYLIVPAGIALVAGFCVAMLSPHGAQVSPLLFIGVGVLILALILLLPMKVYKVGFWAAFGFLILAVIVSFILNFGASLALLGSQSRIKEIATKFSTLPQAEQQKFFTALFQQYGLKTGDVLPGEMEAADRSKTPQERLAALKTMYAELEKRRVGIDPNDKAAVKAYDAQRARYDELLKKLQADAAASRR